MNKFLFYLLLFFKTSTSLNNDLKDIVQNWVTNFIQPKDFEIYSKQNQISEETVKPIKKSLKLLSHLDYEDYTFNGKDLEEDTYPFGFGILESKYKEGDQILCFGKKKSKAITKVVGNFSTNGLMNGLCQIKYSDGWILFVNVMNSVAHGFSYEMDNKGSFRYIGRYLNGRKFGRFWYFHDGIINGALTGKVDEYGNFNGNNYHYLFMKQQSKFDVLKGESRNGDLINGTKHILKGVNFDGGILSLDTNPITSENYNFNSYGTITNFEDVFFEINVWYHFKSFQAKRKTVFKKSFNDISELYNPLAIFPIKDYGWRDSSDIVDPICNKIIASYALKEDSLFETPLIAARGTGSKWVSALVDQSTGIQSMALANELVKDFFVEGSNLLIKTHHQELQTEFEKHKRESLVWRIKHMMQYNGTGILLIRNPYDSIISAWNHLGSTEVSTRRDLLQSLTTNEFQKFAFIEFEIWMDTILDWLLLSNDLLVVHYEHFLTDKVSQLRKINTFLKLPIDSKRMECIGKNPINMYKRNGKPQKLKNQSRIFSQKLKTKIIDGIKLVQKILKDKQFDEIPLEKYNLYD